MERPPANITQLLHDWRDGDERAATRLMPLVYTALRRMAHRAMKQERAEHTLQPTALVHEAFLRLVDQKNISWQNRTHFFAIAAKMMRRILIDHARSHHASKRGGSARRLSLEEAAILPEERAADLIALDDALQRLAVIDGRKSQIVELRFFGGLSVDEAAQVLAIHRTTLLREWKVAKLWLHREMSETSPP